MMEIQLSPVAGLPGRDDDVISVFGNTLTYNGTDYDLSEIKEEDVAFPEGDHPFTDTITRDGGVLKFGLRMVYNAATAEPMQPTDPAHWLVEIENGNIPDLVIRKPDGREEFDFEEETQDDL